MTVRVEFVSSEDEYWVQFDRLKGSCAYFDDQGDAHGVNDFELQEAIENLLVPIVGPWEGSDVWFQHQDFYGNGVRSVTFRAGDFPWQTVRALQKLLVGASARFCISVHFTESLLGRGRWVGSMGVLADVVVATPYVVEMLKQHTGIET